jgi:uncharacterized membrane protein YjgN (DUF898 family)
VLAFALSPADVAFMTDPQPPSTEQHPGTPAPPRTLIVAFRGSAREYFRIWAVNLCLTLLTLGIFSAWAKVRKKRYFYSHTTLDDTPFQYLGQPLPILKGRVVAVVLFLLYYASSNFFTVLLPYVLAAGLVLAPWVIVRSAAFNARYSAFRNMTFHFDAKYRDALKVIYWLGLIPVLVVGGMFSWWGNLAAAGLAYAIFGFAFPWWLRGFKNFLVGHTVFGGANGKLSVTGGQFFKIYFLAGLIIGGISLVTGLVVAATFAAMKVKMSPFTFVLLSLPIYAGYVLAFAYIQAHSSNLVWNRTQLGPLRFQSTLSGRGLAKLYLTNALAIVASVGLLTPWAVMRTLKYRADNMRVLLDGALTDFRGSEATAVQATGAELGEFFDVDLSL